MESQEIMVVEQRRLSMITYYLEMMKDLILDDLKNNNTAEDVATLLGAYDELVECLNFLEERN